MVAVLPYRAINDLALGQVEALSFALTMFSLRVLWVNGGNSGLHPAEDSTRRASREAAPTPSKRASGHGDDDERGVVLEAAPGGVLCHLVPQGNVQS